MNKVPNPGSVEATDLGCTCPVIDNHFGNGVPGQGFWITSGCPLHDTETSEAKGGKL